MKARLEKIGNSKGIRIPKLLLEQSKLSEDVVLEAENDRIVIRSARQPRHDWEALFRVMSEHGDDELLDKALPAQSQWDGDVWQW